MKIVFMGTPDFSVSALNSLAEAHEISMVVTQPDRARGRGKKVIPSPVKKRALELGIPVFQPKRLRDQESMDRVIEESADVIVVVAFGQILPKEILEAPEYGCINIHASILPKHRGAAPIHRAIQAGDKKSGVTIMQMDEGLDTGDMLMTEEVAIPSTMTTGQLHDQLSELGARMINDALYKLEKGEIEKEPQDHQKASYAAKISKEEAEIDWHLDAESIHNSIRAFDPFPGAWTRFGSIKLKCFASSFKDLESKGVPGEIIEVTEGEIFVQTGKGILLLTEIQAPGKRRMPVSEFLRGNALEKGVVLLSRIKTQEK